MEKAMATHSSVLAWRIPGTAEPGGLPSMWLHRVGHDWSNLAAAAAAAFWLKCLIYLHLKWLLLGLDLHFAIFFNTFHIFSVSLYLPSFVINKHVSVQFSHSAMSDSLQLHESQHTRPPCPSPTPGVHSDSRPSIQWCHPAISASVIPFSSCPQSLPASGSFPVS